MQELEIWLPKQDGEKNKAGCNIMTRLNLNIMTDAGSSKFGDLVWLIKKIEA